ncbi:MAG: hypothetical protein FJ128_02455 [Deltaproteobacteria bacterium]|nr:hypothetical protein [Deltaproteobacteria bacterium]
MEARHAIRDIRHSLHELAQPLAAVTGLLDLLLLEQKMDAAFQDELHLISERLERVLDIIAHIRDIVRTASLTEGEEVDADTDLMAVKGRFSGI